MDKQPIQGRAVVTRAELELAIIAAMDRVFATTVGKRQFNLYDLMEIYGELIGGCVAKVPRKEKAHLWHAAAVAIMTKGLISQDEAISASLEELIDINNAMINRAGKGVAGNA